MGQIIKSLLSFGQFVCKHYGCNFDLKSKIEFVWDKNLITLFPILPQFLKKFALRPMETRKWYNSVSVKDNCVLCLPTL